MTKKKEGQGQGDINADFLAAAFAGLLMVGRTSKCKDRSRFPSGMTKKKEGQGKGDINADFLAAA